MAHPVRRREAVLVGGALEHRRTGEQALARLRTVAGRGGGDATVVSALLESAADAAEAHTSLGALPAEEQALWASTGARFDGRARLGNDRRLVAAFGDLLGRSILGDAAMAEALGVDRSRVSQRLAEGSLLAFTAGEERCFPRWQLVDGKPLPGLKVVLQAADPALHPLTADHWFTSPNADLEIGGEPASPAAWLATGGDPGAVADLAADL